MIPELLAPAGSPEKLRYAFAYGADAVYAGIPKFSLRAKENPFKGDSLKENIAYSHSVGKKLYVTANILPPNRKINSFKKSLVDFAEAGADAFIMADPGLINFALKECPDIPIHLSVQTNTMNWPSVEFWYEQGVKRVILSRELTLEEIHEIHEKVPGMELEAFVHGSICIAYSGRCLLSNYFNHRDANQGTCTNSCRWEYNIYGEKEKVCGSDEKPTTGNYFIEETDRPGELMPIEEDEHGTYIMNSKDLRAIEFLKEMRAAGVMSFKMEGRSKSIYYLSIITRAYRRAIDDLVGNRPFDPNLLGEVAKTANREFTSAFLISNANHDTERFDSAQNPDQHQVFGGQVVTGIIEDGYVEVNIRNRMEVGDEVECISPEHQYRFTISALRDKEGNDISVCHGGAGSTWIRAEGPMEAFALLSLIKTPVENPVAS